MRMTGQPAVLSARISMSETQQWKTDGGRVIGFFCSYVPEELIHAAGAMPYRVSNWSSVVSFVQDSKSIAAFTDLKKLSNS